MWCADTIGEKRTTHRSFPWFLPNCIDLSVTFFFKAYQIFCPLYDSLGESFHRCCCLKTGHVYHFKFDFPFWTISVHLSWDFLYFCLFLLSFFWKRKKNYMGSSSVKRSEFDAHVIVAAHLLFPPCLFDVALFSDRKGVGSDRTLKRDWTHLSFQCVLFYVLWLFFLTVSTRSPCLQSLQSDPLALGQQISTCCTRHTLTTVRLGVSAAAAAKRLCSVHK